MFGFRRKSYLSAEAEAQIVAAISAVESHTRAEIRVHLASRTREDVYGEAVKVFKRLGMHRTELRNGVLIYVVPTEKKFAIVGDLGIHEKVKESFWVTVKDVMTRAFAEETLEAGIIKGIELAGAKLAEYFPSGGHNPNEISNEISRS